MAAAGQSGELQYEQDHATDMHVHQLITIFAVSLAMAYCAVALRLVSRRVSKTRLSWDDWAIILSLVSSSAK